MKLLASLWTGVWATSGAFGCNQLPAFILQYTHRLDGAAAENARNLLLGRFTPEAVDEVTRHTRAMAEAAAELQRMSGVAKVGAFLRTFEPIVAAETLATFEPVLALSRDALIYGAVGLIVGSLFAWLTVALAARALARAR